MFSEDVEESLMNLGRLISEVRFRKMPDSAIVELLCEKSSGIRIHLDLVAPLRISEGSGISWLNQVASARLASEFLSDWRELSQFSALKELDLAIHPMGESSFDTRDLAEMQRAILNLEDLRRLTFDVSELYPDQADALRRVMTFQKSELKVSFRERNNGRKKNRRQRE